MFDWTEVGDTVWTEGVEEFFTHDGRHVAIPYVAIYEFQDGLILNWREYFEGRIFEDMLEGGKISPEVEAMINRPEA